MHWNFGIVSWMTSALTLSDAAARRLRPCSHPHPHYLRPEPARTEADGTILPAQPARYRCFECGRTWDVTQRDPAWAPTGIVQKFTGHDPTKATSAILRATIEAEQRRFLAVNRTTIPRPAVTAPPRSAAPRRRRLPSNVVHINSRRRPA